MLRLIYLGLLFKLGAEGSWRVLCIGCCMRRKKATGASLTKYEEEECDPGFTRPGMKRRLVKRAVSPSAALTSTVADIDVMADWFFWATSDFDESKYDGIEHVALFFTVLGTVTWLLLATDGLGWLRICACKEKSCFSIHQYWSLVNTFVEDLPQLVITFLTGRFNTVAGALNIATAVFAFMAKAAEAYASRQDDLPSDFQFVEDTEGLMKAQLKRDDERDRGNTDIRQANPLIVIANTGQQTTDEMVAAFELARSYGDWIGLVTRLTRISFTDESLPGACGEPLYKFRSERSKRRFSLLSSCVPKNARHFVENIRTSLSIYPSMGACFSQQSKRRPVRGTRSDYQLCVLQSRFHRQQCSTLRYFSLEKLLPLLRCMPTLRCTVISLFVVASLVTCPLLEGTNQDAHTENVCLNGLREVWRILGLHKVLFFSSIYTTGFIPSTMLFEASLNAVLSMNSGLGILG